MPNYPFGSDTVVLSSIKCHTSVTRKYSYGTRTPMIPRGAEHQNQVLKIKLLFWYLARARVLMYTKTPMFIYSGMYKR